MTQTITPIGKGTPCFATVGSPNHPRTTTQMMGAHMRSSQTGALIVYIQDKDIFSSLLS